MSKIKTCIVCGKKYEFCAHCRRTNSNDLWRNIYCSKECREIFDTCSRYAGHSISAEDAYNKLIEYNFERKDIQMSVKNTVDEIIEEVEKVDVPKEGGEETKTETIISEDTPKFRRPRRRRNKKSNNE